MSGSRDDANTNAEAQNSATAMRPLREAHQYIPENAPSAYSFTSRPSGVFAPQKNDSKSRGSEGTGGKLT